MQLLSGDSCSYSQLNLSVCELIDGSLQRLEALLRAKEVVLTSREVSLLAITEIVSAGLNPWDEQFVVRLCSTFARLQYPAKTQIRSLSKTNRRWFSCHGVVRSSELQWVLLENVHQMFHSKFKNEALMSRPVKWRRDEKGGFKACVSLLLNNCYFGSCAQKWSLYVRATNVALQGFTIRSDVFSMSFLEEEFILTPGQLLAVNRC